MMLVRADMPYKLNNSYEWKLNTITDRSWRYSRWSQYVWGSE